MKTDNKIIVIPDFFIFLRAIDKNINKSTTDIQIMTRITYSHLHHMKKVLSEKGYITIEKIGVKTLLNTTVKGHKVVQKINDLLNELCIDDIDLMKFRKNTKHKYGNVEIEVSVKKLLKETKKIIMEENIIKEKEVLNKDTPVYNSMGKNIW